jgi:hypothetical protein
MIKVLIPALCGVLLCSCASPAGKSAAAGQTGAVTPGGARPGWVDGAGTDYPRARFLAGIGAADDQASAMERARGEISRIFSTQVTMNTMVNASERTSSQEGKTSSSYSQDVVQSVRSTSQKVLEGAEIVRTWRDKDTGQYYALAVLERSKALAAISGKLDELDGRARGLAAGLSSETEKLARIKNAMKLTALLKGREKLEADMRVLDPSAATRTGFDVNEAGSAARKALAGLDVTVVMPAEDSSRVRAAVIKTLNALGIDAKTGIAAGGADISVECAVEFAALPDADPRSRWKWSRGSASVSLKDVKTSKIFLNFEASAKEAASTGGEARARAEAALGQKIGAEISGGITGYLENQ